MLVDSMATIYRPTKLSQVVGQKAVVSRLKGIFSEKKIPKSIAIIGPYGTGKTTLARIIATYVNCDTHTACGKCKNCLEKNHPDVEEINAANARGIDEVRSLIERASYHARISKYRIFILDEIQQWTPQAAQAMLKTLEEPPKNTLFIVCTMQPEKIDSAILSRCNVFQLNRITKEDMVEGLNNILEKEKQELPKSIIEKIAESSGGHMRTALQSLESVLQIKAGLKTKDKAELKKALAKGLSDSIEVKDELVAIKILLSMYTGSIKSLQSAILDVSDYVGTINKLSYLNMYVLDKILVGEHKDIWNTAINAKLMKEVKSRQQEKTIPSDLKFTKSLVEIQSAINNLKSKMGTFMVNERHLFSSEFIQIALKNRATKE